MKVLIGTFVTESNANVPVQATIANYDIAFGDDLIRKMGVKDIYDAAGIEIVPSIYADAGGHGVVTKNAFDYIESCFVNAVKAHLHELDGIYLFLHGASEVEGLH
ncbi:MAG: M81 family metallopeptidase, partial [Erysipelotrichaceae bacterium]|nr:M81 family metallopeptidase [Erysipelotrichaceae bacterium]